MRLGYDIMFPTAEDSHRVDEQYERTIRKYESKGYAMPSVALQMVKDMYNDQFDRERKDSYWQGKEYADICGIRIDLLSRLTQTRLLKEAMDIFDKDPDGSFVLGFKDGKPDGNTKEFFNLKDEVGYLNKTRTESLRLPGSFCGEQVVDELGKNNFVAGEHYFCVFRDGEQVSQVVEGQEKIILDTLAEEMNNADEQGLEQ